MFEIYILPIILFAVLGAVAGGLLTVASKIFAVKTDERLDLLGEALPQINCGACGFSGCGDYASSVLYKNAPTNMCKPGGDATSMKISEIMGVAFSDVIEEIAFVRCGGGCEATTTKYIFEGTQSCAASNRFYNGSKTCTHGCLGFGDCKVVCPNKAINITDGIAVIDLNACVGCGLCVKACPNHLIIIKPSHKHVDVACSSTSIGKVTKSMCTNGCIGCKICEKKCPVDAIKVDNNVASIDYLICTNCGTCFDACPTGAIQKN